MGRVQAGFDVEQVTRQFYERFKTEHDKFLKFIDGIPDENMAAWYASVMINRLMFLYFLQAKGFLDGDNDYLRNKLKESRDRKKDGYYRDFLCTLFFEGFACKKEERSAAVNKLLGNIPYLNGGLFQRHQIEELHGKKIDIPDTAFQRLFDFFKEYNWHLDERENRNDNEINPDVLGYIFEKYINQKQMGAYYTKEDITGYISQNTIIPFLLDAAARTVLSPSTRMAASGACCATIRIATSTMPCFTGTKHALPPEIAAGISDVEQAQCLEQVCPRGVCASDGDLARGRRAPTSVSKSYKERYDGRSPARSTILSPSTSTSANSPRTLFSIAKAQSCCAPSIRPFRKYQFSTPPAVPAHSSSRRSTF